VRKFVLLSPLSGRVAQKEDQRVVSRGNYLELRAQRAFHQGSANSTTQIALDPKDSASWPDFRPQILFTSDMYAWAHRPATPNHRKYIQYMLSGKHNLADFGSRALILDEPAE
jgi:hypothetical protein